MGAISTERLTLNGFRALRGTGNLGDHITLNIPTTHHRDEEKQITMFTHGAIEYHRLVGERLWKDRNLIRKAGDTSLDFNKKTDLNRNENWPDEWVTEGKMRLEVIEEPFKFYCIQFEKNRKLKGTVYKLKSNEIKKTDESTKLLFVARGSIMLEKNEEVYNDPTMLRITNSINYTALNDDQIMIAELYELPI
jgi:hypothetical protein